MNRNTESEQRQRSHEIALYAARLRYDAPAAVRAGAKARAQLRADLDAATRKDTP